MSGILASSMIAQDASCKIYTNSSGNAASITIHSHVPSSTENACLSIKISSTDACICTNAVDSTTDVAPTDTVGIVYDSTYSWDGFTCLQNSTTKSVMSMAFSDSGGTCHSAIDTPTLTNRMSLHGVYSATGNRPVSDTYFATCAFCCPRCEARTGGSHCCYNLWAHLSRPIPNFHTTTSGERHVHLPIAHCGACWMQFSAYNYHSLNNENCCYICTSTPELKYETYLNTIDCLAACPACVHKYHIRDFMGNNCTGWYAVDLWSCAGTTAYYEDLYPPESCPTLSIRVRVRICCEQPCYTSCQIGLPRCYACDLFSSYMRKVLLECCCCCVCCCNVDDQRMQTTFPARKPIMFGCDFMFAQTLSGQCSYFLGYRYDCIIESQNQFCQICNYQPLWTSFGNYECNSCGSCAACCTRVFKILDMGSGMTKWAWYNPYNDCNYIAVLDGTACDYGGIYSFEIRCTDADGIFCQAHCSCRIICKTFADWVSDGWFQKVQSTPSAWERFTCICGRAGCMTFMSNPTLIGECCWAVWAQCFNWGDVTLDETGWNGCMLRYHSNDLANWKLTTDEVSVKVSSGSGDTECIKSLLNDGSNFSTAVNHYFNSANCVSDAGTIEYKTSTNRLERTGIVVSNGDSVYVNNSGTKVGVTIWGYDD